MKILIVDDKRESLYLLEQMLATSGYEVLAATHGVEALETLSTQSCNLIISDILMPVMDGFQLCRHIKKHDELRAIPFIFYTATYTDKKDEEFALSLGADCFIRKPSEPEELLRHIKYITDNMQSDPNNKAHASSCALKETEVLKLYNERLINRLEKKLVELEQETKERKRGETRQSELLRMLEASLNELYVFHFESLKFIEGNSGARENLGYSIEELSRLTPLDLMIEFSPDSFDKLLRPIRTGEEKRIQFTTIHRRKNGTLYPVEVYLERSTSESLPAFMAIVLDITERKHAEEAFRQTEQKLHQLQKMEALGTLSAGIAHDFNNILGAILGYTELALIKIFPNGDVYQNLQQVLKAGNRAKELVAHILTFSRQVDQQRIPTELHFMVKEALDLLRATLPSTITIQQSLSTQPGVVLADPTQIHQVLMNLCTNAEHAMRENGGILEVSLDHVEISRHQESMPPELKPGLYHRLSISDTGNGIPPKIQNRIFEPFFTTKRMGEGTGMGLSVVHGIIANHEGAITVESTLGKGTRFDIYFPQTNEVIESEIEVSPPTQPKQGCILFVDDEEPLTQLGQKMLQQLGYEAVVRTNSLEALRVFRNDPFHYDVVITDQTMPNLTGDALARELLSIRPELPIILCTGFSYTMTPEKATAMGIRAFLMKPILSHELAQTIQRVLG
ncbi:response regulator [Candidatus Nitrospira salsa]